MFTIKTGIIIPVLINGNFIFPKYEDSSSKPLHSHDSLDNINVDVLSCKSWSFFSKRHPNTSDYGIRNKFFFPMRAGQYP